MKRFLPLFCLVAAMLACVIPVSTRIPITNTPTATRLVTATRSATRTPTAATRLWTAKVQLPTVNVRQSANGPKTGKYLTVGETVTILACDESWCQIKDPAGWVWRGCLSDNPEGLGCETK